MIESPATKFNSKTPSPQVLIVSPTRELALQTAETLTMLCDLLNWKTVCLFGGMPKTEQVRQLNQKDLKVVVGTPGRVLDLLNDGAVSFDKVTYLVLDEADRMLDKGFENDIRQIIAQTPTEGRQTLMFSATWPDSVRGLAATFMKEPVRITVGSDELAANTRVSQSAYCSPSSVHYGSAADLLLLPTSSSLRRRGLRLIKGQGPPTALGPPIAHQGVRKGQLQGTSPHPRLCALQEGSDPARANDQARRVCRRWFARRHGTAREDECARRVQDG